MTARWRAAYGLDGWRATFPGKNMTIPVVWMLDSRAGLVACFVELDGRLARLDRCAWEFYVHHESEDGAGGMSDRLGPAEPADGRPASGARPDAECGPGTPLPEPSGRRTRSRRGVPGARSLSEVAGDLSVSLRQVRHWVESGDLPAVNISQGRERAHLRILDADLAAFLEARRREDPRSPSPLLGQKCSRATAPTRSAADVAKEMLQW